ncbi:MAG: preprotein translocase subunit SecE [bacterium]
MFKWYKKLKKFLYEVWLEARPGGRVNWPSKSKLLESTLLVLVCAFIFMVYVGLLDLIFGQIFIFLTGA